LGLSKKRLKTVRRGLPKPRKEVKRERGWSNPLGQKAGGMLSKVGARWKNEVPCGISSVTPKGPNTRQ